MTRPTPPHSARQNPGLLALCLLLWFSAVVLAGLTAWLVYRGIPLYGALALLVAALLAAASLGLYRYKRWGVVLFGLLVILGSIDHLAGVLFDLAAISTNDVVGMLGALLNILLAIAIPTGLIYVTLILWRQAK